MSHWPRQISLMSLLLVSFLATASFADDSMNCPGTLPNNHATLAAGDQSTANHLQVSRSIEPGTEFDIDVCAADVILTASPDNELRITVDIARPSSQHNAVDYLHTLDISNRHAKLQLHLLRELRAKVTIEVPAGTPDLTLNLGRGDLTLAAARIGGKSENINVGMGHINFEGNADAYEELQINVGLGSLHDNRPDGQNHHFIVARSLEGTGKGSIEMNVGMGSVDLNPSQAKPI